jgi:hypothetical protein
MESVVDVLGRPGFSHKENVEKLPREGEAPAEPENDVWHAQNGREIQVFTPKMGVPHRANGHGQNFHNQTPLKESTNENNAIIGK